MLISILGKSGSGKSTAAKMFNEIDPSFMVLDLDKLIHHIQTLPDVKREILKNFGSITLNSDGSVNRSELGKIVFSDENKLTALEEILYSQLEIIVDGAIKENRNVVLEAIKIHKTKYFKQSDITILIESEDNIRKDRIIKRDNITEERFASRDKNSDNLYAGLKFDYCINNKNTQELRKEVKDIYEQSIISRQF